VHECMSDDTRDEENCRVGFHVCGRVHIFVFVVTHQKNSNKSVAAPCKFAKSRSCQYL
jgi:hypothetical protein